MKLWKPLACAALAAFLAPTTAAALSIANGDFGLTQSYGNVQFLDSTFTFVSADLGTITFGSDGTFINPDIGTLLPGATFSFPLMPLSGAGIGFSFSFLVPTDGAMWFIDPLIATGYDYAITSAGATFSSVKIATAAGDGLYNLYDTSGGSTVLLRSGLATGETFNFSAGVSTFRIDGIEPSAGLNPTDTSAFVTGISLNTGGPASAGITQTPIVTDTGNTTPEPVSAALAGLGLAGLGALRRRR